MRLDEYTKDEWRDVCMKARPDLSDDEFEQLWADFQAMKRAREGCSGEA